MSHVEWITMISILIHFTIQLVLSIRVILRPHRDPASRVAWLVFIIAVPFLGVVAYILLGDISIGRNRIARMDHVVKRLPKCHDIPGMRVKDIQPKSRTHWDHLFQVGQSINGFEAIGGNHGRLLPDSYASIDAMVADIDAATSHVHFLVYIWLSDTNGRKILDAIERAARRGVVCRVMADGLGSRILIQSDAWQKLQQSGAKTAVALPIRQTILAPLFTRVDLRNHRKILVIDNRITYCGSQNCADPEFRIKAKYAPWVDAVIRFEGPIARQNQLLFAADWMAHVDEDITDVIMEPVGHFSHGFVAQAIGTGPTYRYSAMPEMFESLMYSARKELLITTPYYVPDEPMQAALCASGRRGVETTLILPAKNDSWFVAAASRSYYADLLASGVRIFEYVGGLLHTKSLTIDGEISLIGSANLDRRSFELNYENNILFHDVALTSQLRERQLSYRWQSHEVTRESVAQWPVMQRLLNNTVAMMGPAL